MPVVPKLPASGVATHSLLQYEEQQSDPAPQPSPSSPQVGDPGQSWPLVTAVLQATQEVGSMPGPYQAQAQAEQVSQQ